jgi:hypothetical protein
MMMSAASAISKPPPRQRPLTAAITGFQRSNREQNPPKPVAGSFGTPWAAVHLRSLPEENAFSPAPVMTATQTFESAATSSHAVDSSSMAGGWRAFITSGRLIVIVAT